MPGWIFGYGAALTALGLGGFAATGARHRTALIPVAFGAGALGLGWMARRPRRRRAAALGTSALAALAVAGSAPGLRGLPGLVRREPVARPAAVVSQSLKAALSVAAIALGLR
jgi:hypothetical protein